MTNPITTPSIDRLVGRWTVDQTASHVGIAHKTFWGLATVKGRFTITSGEATVDPAGDVTGAVVIDARSIDTKNSKRDEHLRSADFFDAEHHPTIGVQITAATLQGDRVTLHAELTVKDMQESITLTGQVVEESADAVTLTAAGEVDRERFAMSWNRLRMMTGTTTVTVNAVFRRG